MSSLLRLLERGAVVALSNNPDGYAVNVDVSYRGRKYPRAVSTVGDFDKQLAQALLAVLEVLDAHRSTP